MAHRRDVAGEANHLDLVGPAYITLNGKGGGEIVFGALRAALERGVVSDGADFDWRDDEMNKL